MSGELDDYEELDELGELALLRSAARDAPTAVCAWSGSERATVVDLDPETGEIVDVTRSVRLLAPSPGSEDEGAG